jgi:shikimate kinase
MRAPAAEALPIFLIGFPGSGKSTVGLLLDAVIEQEAGATVREIFAAEGEAAFRAREAQALRRVASAGPQVVAVGGGAPCFGDNLDVMIGAGVVVCLSAPVPVLVQRLGDAATRPLLAGTDLQAEVTRRLAEREPYYRRAPVQVDTAGLVPSQVAARVAQELEAWR